MQKIPMQVKGQSQKKSQEGTAVERATFSHVSLYMISVREAKNESMWCS